MVQIVFFALNRILMVISFVKWELLTIIQVLLNTKEFSFLKRFLREIKVFVKANL